MLGHISKNLLTTKHEPPVGLAALMSAPDIVAIVIKTDDTIKTIA